MQLISSDDTYVNACVFIKVVFSCKIKSPENSLTSTLGKTEHFELLNIVDDCHND